jgi:hypothetical protein
LDGQTVEYRGVELQISHVSDLILSEYQQAYALLYDELLFKAREQSSGGGQLSEAASLSRDLPKTWRRQYHRLSIDSGPNRRQIDVVYLDRRFLVALEVVSMLGALESGYCVTLA